MIPLTRRRFLASLAAAPLAVKAFISDGASSLSLLKGKKVSTALYTNITTSEAVERVADAAGWPIDKRLIADSQTTFEWWHTGYQDPHEAFAETVRAEGPGASFYEDENGNLVFETGGN